MRKVLSLALAIVMVLSLTIVAVGAVDTDVADAAAGKLTVTANDLKGGTVTQTYSVGETFTVSVTLNCKNIKGKDPAGVEFEEGGLIGSFKGQQLYDSEVLELADEYDPEKGDIKDLVTMFPVTKTDTVANGKKIGGIYFNASKASYSGYPFNTDDSCLIVAHYTVTGTGEATIDTSMYTLAVSDFKLTRIIDKGEIVNDDFTTQVFLSEPAATGSTLSGKVTSFVTTEEAGTNYATTVELLQGETVVKTVSNDEAAVFDYTFEDVEEGDYTLCVSKQNHVTREYAVTVSGDTTQDAKIHPIGDISGDGKVNTFDYGRVNSHARSKSSLTGYEFLCGDVNNDGKVNTFDAGRVNSMARSKSSLWT